MVSLLVGSVKVGSERSESGESRSERLGGGECESRERASTY